MASQATQQQKPQSSVDREEFDTLKGTVDQISSVMSTIAEKLDAIAAVDQGRMRFSREQEMNGEGTIHDPHDVDDDLIISHPSLQARPGMAQMWIRLTLQGIADSGNVLRMCAPNRGWKPRDPSTLPKDLASVMTKTLEGEPIIQYRDLALFERPVKRNAKDIAETQHRADMLIYGIESDLRREHVPGQQGFGMPAFTERKRTVAVGRKAEPD